MLAGLGAGCAETTHAPDDASTGGGAGPGHWTDLTPCHAASWPHGADGDPAFAVDTARRRMVLLARSTYYPVFVEGPLETWELDLDTGAWWERTPCPGASPDWPIVRTSLDANPTPGYDPVAKVVVLPWDGRRWEWRGEAGTWTDAGALPKAVDFQEAESGRSIYDASVGALAWFARSSGLTYELDRTTGEFSRVVAGKSGFAQMDGNAGRMVVLASDKGTTWEWDRVSGWVDRTPTPLPAAWPTSAAGVMTFDSNRNRVLYFSFISDAVWSWNHDAGLWTREAINTPKDLMQIGFDDVRNRIVVLTREFGHMFEWDGTSPWVDRTADTTPRLWPRAGSLFTYDTRRDRLIGLGAEFLEWDGVARHWDLAPPGGAPTPAVAGTAYDEDRGRLMVLSPDGTLHEWDGLTWTERAKFAGEPDEMHLAYWRSTGNLVAFNRTYPLVWTWSSSDDRWDSADPSTPIIGTIIGDVAIDQARGVLVVSTELGMQEFDLRAHKWTLKPGTGLSSLAPVPLAFNATTGRVAAAAVDSDGVHVSSWDGVGWAPHALLGKTVPHVTPRHLLYDGQRSRLLLFGEDGSDTSRASRVWELTDGT